MPINAGPEYFLAEKKYLEARTREEKIKALEEMIRLLPKHKGVHNILSQLKKRLSTLKKETKTKASAKPRFSIKKEGAGQVCIVGLTNSGKSSLLNALTGVDVEIADYPYTTKIPKVAMMQYGDVQIQLIEIPSTFDSDFVSILHTCDLILILLDATQDTYKQLEEVTEILENNGLEKNKLIIVVNKNDLQRPEGFSISAKEKLGLEELKEKIWSELGLIRVYTKSPGKQKIVPPLTLPKESTVRDVAKSVHKDFLKNFRFARVFNSTKYSGQKVGLDFKLNDMDVVEIHTK